MPPITLATAASSRPASSSASVNWTSPVASNGHRDRTVEVGAEADVLDAGDVDRVADRPRDRRRGRRRRRRSARTRSRRGRRSRRCPASMGVGQIAGVVAHAADAGVRRDDRPGRPWPGRRRSSRRTRGRRRRACPRASIRRTISRPGVGQATLLDAVGRSAERVVEEMARRHHPEARVGDDLDVRRVAVERVGALDREEARRERRVGERERSRRRSGRRGSG